MLMHKLMAYLAETVIPTFHHRAYYEVHGVDSKTSRNRRFTDTSNREFELIGIITPRPDAPYINNIVFTQDDVVSLTINEQSPDNGFAIGSAVSAQYRLVLDKSVILDSDIDSLNGVWIAAMLGLKGSRNDHDYYDFEPFGVWMVENSISNEHDPSIQLEGYDALNAYYSTVSVREMWWNPYGEIEDIPLFDDEGDLEAWQSTNPYDPLGTIRDQLNRFTDSDYSEYYGVDVNDHNIVYEDTDANIYVFDRPNDSITTAVLNYDIIENEKLFIDIWDNSYSWRDLIMLIAGATGCFAHINRSGALEFKHYNRAQSAGSYDIFIDRDKYYSYTPDATKSFNTGYAYITYITDQSGENYKVLHTPFVWKQSGAGYIVKPYSPYDTVFIGENPIITESIADALSDMFLDDDELFDSEAAEVSFIGSPALEPGDRVALYDDSSVMHYFIINSMTTTFDGGLHQTVACTLPSESEANGTDTPSTISSTPTGTGGSSGIVPNYSTEETYTGMRWIDGKPIYRYVTTYTTSSTSTSANAIDTLPSIPVVIVNLYGFLETSQSIFPINMYRPASAVQGTACWIRKSDGAIMCQVNSQLAISRTLTIIVEYTKDTGEELEFDI